MNELEISLEAVSHLKEGRIILYPTDTIWGIGCDATRPESIQRVFDIKRRTDSKSMVILVANDAMLNRVIPTVPAVAWDLFDTATEPLTLVLPNANWVAKNVCAEDGSVAVRMIKTGALHKMINNFGRPIVSTSANISGDKSPNSFSDINPLIKEKVDYTVLFPDLGTKKPSSILKIGLKGEVQILRA
ncbi:MAG: Sua5/YciO/YrdC/YwlC family protein [Flavobacteriales bacterium]|nr:Sua5/YciO/YrdC/YwlC family protein [Flavobacteriales bacterium]